MAFKKQNLKEEWVIGFGCATVNFFLNSKFPLLAFYLETLVINGQCYLLNTDVENMIGWLINIYDCSKDLLLTSTLCLLYGHDSP